jgi:hypothetical protein
MSSTTIDLGRNYTLREAAEFFTSPYGRGHVTPHTVRNWIKCGQIGYVRQGKFYFVPGAAIRAKLAEAVRVDGPVPRITGEPEKRELPADLKARLRRQGVLK